MHFEMPADFAGRTVSRYLRASDPKNYGWGNRRRSKIIGLSMAIDAFSSLLPLKGRLNRGNHALATEAEAMHEENLANTLDRILAERLREFPVTHPKILRGALYRVTGWFRRRSPSNADLQPDLPSPAETIARIRSLPTHGQVALRRYFVFREAEESICLSIDMSPGKFRRFLRDAADYILMRQDRMPQLEQKQPSNRGSRDRRA